MFDLIKQGMRYALRQLQRAPLFTTLSVLTFTVCIAAVALVSTVVNAVLWRPLPFADSDRLALISGWGAGQPVARQLLSYPDLVNVQDRCAGLAETAAYMPPGIYNLLWQRPSGQVRVAGSFVSPNFFSVLQARPAIGRIFTAEHPGSVVVLSHRFWRMHFGGDPGAVGISMSFPEAFTIVGVMPPEFHLDEDIDLWLPYQPSTFAEWGRDRRAFTGVARFRPGVDIALLDRRLTADSRVRFLVTDLRQALVGDARPALFLLFAAVCAVVLLGCANLGTLLLGQAVGREREISIRLALGATPRRLLSQLLTESAVLAWPGGMLGIVAAVWLIQVLPSFPTSFLPGLREIHADIPLLAAASASMVLCGLLAGLAPARHLLRGRIGTALSASHLTEPREARRTRRILASLQIGLAFSLLMATGLTLRSLRNVLNVDLGFRPQGLLTVQLSSDIEDVRRRLAFYEDLRGRVQAMPGVSGAAYSTRVPLREGGAARVEVFGRADREDARVEVEVRSASREYFRTMGIPLTQGRAFAAGDRLGTQVVAVVNETAARRLWPAERPIGRRVRLANAGQDGPWHIVVGVVGDVRHFGPESEPRPEVYLCFEQGPPFGVMLTVRAESNVASLEPLIKDAVRGLDPDTAAFGITTMEELLADRTAPRRYGVSILTGFGMLAIALAIIGVYATISHVMSGRRREMAVRMAFGATPSSVLLLSLRDAVRYILPGLLFGAAGGLCLMRLFSSMLFGVSEFDPLTLVLISTGLIGVVLLASVVPAARVSRVDPAGALRTE